MPSKTIVIVNKSLYCYYYNSYELTGCLMIVQLIGLAIAAIGAVLQAAAGSTFLSFLETSIKSILSTYGKQEQHYA